MSYFDDDMIERKASAIRSALGIAHQEKPDVASWLPKAKALKWLRGWRGASLTELPDHDAYIDDNKVMVLREDILRGVLAQIPSRPARFTVAHELSHLAFRHPGRHFRAALSFDGQQRRVPLTGRVASHEIEANRLAAALLVPLSLIGPDDDISIQALSERFDVSRKVIEIRLPIIERHLRRLKIYAERYRRLLITHHNART